MNTLLENGFVVKEDRSYRLAPQFLTYGEHVRNNLPLYRAGREVVDNVAYESGKNAHLVTEHDGHEVTLYQSFGEDSVGSDLYIWHQAKLVWQLHWSASGKAILAHLPEERVRNIVDEYGLKQRTQNTITDEEELFEELARIREQGYALNDEEEMSGMRAVAAPIKDQNQRLLGSISLSGPVSKIPDNMFYETYPDFVIDKANVIKIALQKEEL
jgi:DNA-binding IclR family transcriptional regulator